MRYNRHCITLALLVFLLSAGCKSKYRLNREDLIIEPAWPYYRGDLSSLGAKPQGAFSGKLDILWENRSNDKPAGPLTIYHDRLVYPGARNRIKFFDSNNGDYVGYVKPKGTPQTGLVIKDSLAYFAVGPKRNKLICVNLFNGNKLWERQVKDASGGSIIVGDRLVVGSGEGLLKALNPSSGKLEWQFKAKGKFNLPAAFGSDKLFQPGDNGTLYALSIEDGAELFQVKLEGPLVSPVAVADLVYAADMTGNVYGIDPDQGRIIWNSQIGGPIWTSVAVANGRLYVGHSGGEMVALDATDGDILWRFETAEVVRSSAVVAGDYVAFGTMGGKLFLLNAADGSMADMRQLNGAIVSAPVTDGDRLYVATEKGVIICFGDRNESNNPTD